MRKAMLLAVLAMASPLMAFPEAADRLNQPWEKIEFIAHKAEGFANGYFFDIRTGNHLTFISKQAAIFLRGIVAVEFGGAGNLKAQAFAVAPALNLDGLFSIIPILEKMPILKKVTIGYAFAWSPDGVAYEKGTAHFLHGPRGGIVYKW